MCSGREVGRRTLMERDASSLGVVHDPRGRMATRSPIAKVVSGQLQSPGVGGWIGI